MNLYCRHCGTENEEKYTYCKNCGTPLHTNRTDESQQSSYRYNYYADKIPDEIDGIPSSEIGCFVNKNQFKILDKFAKMSYTGSKISWCWPAAIFSFFFGFFGAAFWLFYRKMYKFGAFALAIGILLSALTSAVTYQPTVRLFNETTNALYEMQGENADTEEFSESYFKAIEDYSSSREIIFANSLTEVANYAAALFYGLFGMYLYKKHSIKKITEYRTANQDSVYYNYGLSALGGISIGMAILAVFVAFIILNTIITIPLFTLIF